MSRNESTASKRLVQAVVDWLVIGVIFGIYALVNQLVSAKVCSITCMSDVFMELKPETIPFWAVLIYGTVTPVLFIVGIEFFNARLLFMWRNTVPSMRIRLRKFFICTYHGVTIFALGISFVLTMTEIIRKWYGRPRPNFISVCKPDLSNISCTTAVNTGAIFNPIYTGGSFCRSDNPSMIEDARLSFPSNHASYVSFTMVYLIFYVELRLALLRLRHVKALIQIGAISTMIVTFFSRLSDNYNGGPDVLCGFILGLMIGLNMIFIKGRVFRDYEREPQYTDFDLIRDDDDSKL